MPSLAEINRAYSVDRWLESVVAEVVRANESISLDRSELWMFLDSLPVAILVSSDRECSRIVGNIAAQAMLNVPPASNLSQSAPPDELPGFQIFSDDIQVPPEQLPMQRAAAEGVTIGRSECEIRFEGGGSIFIAGHCIAIRDASGAICGSIGAFIDITEQRRHFEESALVAREMAHRVKNTVAIIQALAHGSLRTLLQHEDFSDFEQRLVSIARAQDLLATRGTEGVLLSDLISRTVGEVAQGAMSRVQLSGPAVELGTDAVLPLTMIVHELATNACKYGALKGEQGKLSIDWVVCHSPTCVVRVQWNEEFAHEPAGDIAPGFGTKLIAKLVRGLNSGTFTALPSERGFARQIEFSTGATAAPSA